MAQLLVRKVDEALVRALKLRAAHHGRSAEAEHRAILREALAESAPRPSLKQLLLSMPEGGDDEDFARSPDTGRDVEL